jgi:hypothetical protein
MFNAHAALPYSYRFCSVADLHTMKILVYEHANIVHSLCHAPSFLKTSRNVPYLATFGRYKAGMEAPACQCCNHSLTFVNHDIAKL